MFDAVIETGKTVDVAIETACEKLGCLREDCEWEIVDLPRKMFLGLKTIPAKVKVWRKEEEKPQADIKMPSAAPRHQEAEKTDAAAAGSVQVKPAPQDMPSAAPIAVSTSPQPYEDAQVSRTLVTQGFTEKESICKSYIASIVREFDLEADLFLYREGQGIYLNIVGENLGSLIGRRGETLDSIQYLVGLVVNRIDGEYVRITLDCGDYRAKRKETLEVLAKKLSMQVLKTNHSKILEPMNPFERRVIHAAVSKIHGVSSSSIGNEPNRRVVITSPMAKKGPARGGYRGDTGRGNGGYPPRKTDNKRKQQAGSSRPYTAVQTPPKQTPETTSIANAPIGKLDFDQ